MSYSVGQILYVLNARRMSISVVQVVEELVRRTKTGDEVSYIVSLSPDEEGVALSSLQGTIFTDVAEMRRVMRSNAEQAIERLIGSAISETSKFGTSQQPAQQQLHVEENIEEQFVTLPDGTKARTRFKGIQPPKEDISI